MSGTAKDAGHAIGDAAGKAKVPLIAGGAVLAGLAGGAAIGARGMRRRKKVLGVPMPRRSVLKASTKNLASAASDFGKAAGQMGELTSEVRQTRQAMDKGRSPIEVVLQGLTSRNRRT